MVQYKQVKKLTVLLVLCCVLLIGGFVWWSNGLSPVNVKDTNSKVFVIPKGTPVRMIGNELKKEGLIRDPVVFFIYVKKAGLDRSIQAGSYKLSASMGLPQIIDTMGHGQIDIWVTIPEGLRSEEIAEILESSIPTYSSTWKSALKAEEGYLFPDTYLIPKDADVEQVITILKNNFYTKIEGIGLSKTTPNLKEILTMASLIEREALRDDEKPMIASVITNRLAEGMALDIDASLQYSKGKSTQGKWWDVPTVEDRKIDSEFNTYKYPGLPPSPIANPGIQAISAAKNPASSNYFYYIHDTKGSVHFARTLSEHNSNVAKYLQ